ncbi:MAG: hypothetical protein ACRYHA_25240 [Janthinobacterium lividum]
MQENLHGRKLLEVFFRPCTGQGAAGRFWLSVEAAGARALEVADPRNERCLDAAFVQQTTSGKIRWRMQQDPGLQTGTRVTHDTASGSADAPPVTIGRERSRTLAAIDAFLLGGEGRTPLRLAARRAEGRLLEAIARSRLRRDGFQAVKAVRSAAAPCAAVATADAA